jgi:hypothetical protein
MIQDKMKINDETKYYSPLIKEKNNLKADPKINEDAKLNEEKPIPKLEKPKRYFSSIKKTNKENFNLTISQF